MLGRIKRVYESFILIKHRNDIVIAAGNKLDDYKAIVMLAMQVVLSLIILISGIYALMRHPHLEEWASGVIGAVVGYWLR